jgi:hypothetical protein
MAVNTNGNSSGISSGGGTAYVPKAATNLLSNGGWTATITNFPNPPTFTGTKTSFGVIAANTPTTLINLTGPGIVDWASISLTQGASAGTITLQLVIDGVTIYNTTSASLAAAGLSSPVVVGAALTTNLLSARQTYFSQSFVLTATFSAATASCDVYLQATQ